MSEDAHDSSNKRWYPIPTNPYQDANRKRMEMYKAQQEEYRRMENIDELNKRVLDLQFANTRIYGELQSQRKLCEVLLARLSKYNEPPVEEGYTEDDLKFLKAVGIQP